MQPRATNLDGSLKRADDWSVTPTLVRTGASIGANSTIRCGVTVGRYALIGSGSVVTKDVPAHALVYGNPARVHGYVCRCGEKLVMGTDGMTGFCAACGTYTDILGAA
jgi:acetyltransferase-like isoleucine patch superfamily enzyme